MPAALVLVAHGTSDPRGRASVRAVRSQVARRLPGVTVLDAYVDVQQPRLVDVANSLARAGQRSVIVPLLLSTGYHVQVDIARAVEASPLISATPPLGPQPVLADILRDRLAEAGVGPDEPVVLAAAGSSREAGVAAVRRQAELLAALRPGGVTAAYLSAARPSVDDVLATSRSGPRRVAIASYLLGHGAFQDRLRTRDAVVTEPIGADPRIAELVCERFAACADAYSPLNDSAARS